MKKLIISNIAALLILVCATPDGFAQQKPIEEGFIPEAGSTAIGFGFNPVSGIRANAKFKANDFVGITIQGEGALPYQMFILAQEPMASIRVKHKMSNKVALKASIGFSGAYFNYTEYVRDDNAFFANPLSEDVVVDGIKYHLSGGGASVGLEFTGGSRKLRFVGGVSLLYSFGGGVMNFYYGNKMTNANQDPTHMQLVDPLNDFLTNGDVINGRPTKRYNVGFEHGVGLMCDMGIEWFFAERLSLGANVTFTPIMVAFQPQTYTTYEGYSTAAGQVVEYNKLVSPGSTTLLYGTENIGLVLSLHYYLK